MAKIPEWDPIDFLVQRKFGRTESELIYASLTGRMSHQERDELKGRIEAYRGELELKTPEELNSLVEVETERQRKEVVAREMLEESQRFFSQPHAIADFAHWSKCAHWTIDEAIALSYGREPRVVTWEKLKSITQISKFAAEYERRRDLALRAVAWKQLYDPVLPRIFLAWTRQVDIVVPSELVKGVEKYGGLIANWKDLHDKQAELVKTQESTIQHLQDALESANRSIAKQTALIEQLQRERDDMEARLSSNESSEAVEGKERSTIAALVFGMAISKYRYDPAVARSGTAAMIANDLARLGIEITDETVRKWLNEAKEKVSFKRPTS